MIDSELRQMRNCQSETEYCRQKPAEVAQETFRNLEVACIAKFNIHSRYSL